MAARQRIGFTLPSIRCLPDDGFTEARIADRLTQLFGLFPSQASDFVRCRMVTPVVLIDYDYVAGFSSYQGRFS